MSALHPKADIHWSDWGVRFVPIADFRPLVVAIVKDLLREVDEERSPQLSETHDFIFDCAFLVAGGESCNSAWCRSIAKMIDRADTSWAATRMTHGDSRGHHSADH